MQALEERHAQLRGIGAALLQGEENRADGDAGQNLIREFRFGREAEIAAADDFVVIVDEADDAEGDRGAESQHRVRIAQISPQERGHGDGRDDQDAAHRRRAGLHLMPLRAFGANELLDLHGAQTIHNPRLENDREDHGREARDGSADRDVAKHVERAEIRAQHEDEEIVEHLSAGPCGTRRQVAGLWILADAASARRNRNNGRGELRESFPFSRRASL